MPCVNIKQQFLCHCEAHQIPMVMEHKVVHQLGDKVLQNIIFSCISYEEAI